MLTALISRLIILGFGTLYPAYASFKAVRNKDVKEYVKWMMYWIVFALFICIETFADVLLSFWFPLYYEVKVALVFWLLSPATRGSSFLYRNFVHPAFQRRENEIDEMISKAKERGYNTVLSLGSKTVTYATNMIVQTAMRTLQTTNLDGVASVLNAGRALPASEDVADASPMFVDSEEEDDPDFVPGEMDDLLDFEDPPTRRANAQRSTPRRSTRLRRNNPSNVHPDAPNVVN